MIDVPFPSLRKEGCEFETSLTYALKQHIYCYTSQIRLIFHKATYKLLLLHQAINMFL
jgi:hypothetical protein